MKIPIFLLKVAYINRDEKENRQKHVKYIAQLGTKSWKVVLFNFFIFYP